MKHNGNGNLSNDIVDRLFVIQGRVSKLVTSLNELSILLEYVEAASREDLGSISGAEKDLRDIKHALDELEDVVEADKMELRMIVRLIRLAKVREVLEERANGEPATLRAARGYVLSFFAGLSWQDIQRIINSDPNFEPFESANAVKMAARRYAEARDFPPPPLRKRSALQVRKVCDSEEQELRTEPIATLDHVCRVLEILAKDDRVPLRAARGYVLALRNSLTWREVQERLNRIYEVALGPFRSTKAAEIAIRRHADENGLPPLPLRRPGAPMNARQR